MATERLRVILELEAGQYKREAREAATATGKIGAEATKTAQQTEGATTRMSTSFKGVATAAAGFLAIGAVAEFGSFVRSTIDDASELEQAIGGVEAVFGSLADEILRASEQAADSVGLSERAYNQLAARLGGQLQTFGFTLDETVVKTQDLIAVGADLAATYGGSVEEAVDAISALLRGEANPIERYAIAINQTAINARAMALGLAESSSEVDLQAKAVAALDLLMEQSARSQGQFAREATTAAGQQERLRAEMENMRAEIGEEFLPIWVDLHESFRDALPVIKDVALGFAALTGSASEGSGEMSGWARALELMISPGKAAERLAMDLHDELQRGTDVVGDGTVAWGEHEDAIRRGITGYGEVRDTVGKADEALMNVAQRGGAEAARILRDMANAAGDGAPSIQEMADAIRDVRTAMLEATDPVFAAIAAQQRATDALQAVADVEKEFNEGKATWEDVNVAAADAAEAILEADAANAALGSNADRHVRPMRDALTVVNDHLEDVNVQLDDLLETLQIIDGKNISFRITPTMDAADRALLSGVASGRLAGPQPPRRPSAHNLGRASGGEMRRGEMFRMGEGNAPELFMIPGDNGRVFSNADVNRIIAAFSQSGGGETHMHFHSSGVIQGDTATAVTMAGIARRVEASRR